MIALRELNLINTEILSGEIMRENSKFKRNIALFDALCTSLSPALAMLSALSSSRIATRAKRMPTHSYVALYSTVMGLARQNWQTSGPAPQSLVASDEQEGEAEREPRYPDGSSTNSHRPAKYNEAREPTPKAVIKHTEAMKKSFPEGWQPPRKLSRDAMDGLRSLHAYDPETFSTPVLASKFRISPEAVRRILKSKWAPSAERRAALASKERQERAEWIQHRREEEKEKQEEIIQTMKIGSIRGVDRKDTLSLK